MHLMTGSYDRSSLPRPPVVRCVPACLRTCAHDAAVHRQPSHRAAQVTRLAMVAEDGEAALGGAHSRIAALSQQLVGARDQLRPALANVVRRRQGNSLFPAPPPPLTPRPPSATAPPIGIAPPPPVSQTAHARTLTSLLHCSAMSLPKFV